MVAADVTPALRALLGGSVDYAGLFPPASLGLELALDNHAAYVRDGDAWMLGCFVLPIGKLAEAGQLLAGRFDPEHPLRISALGSKTGSADEFLETLRAGLLALTDFRQAHGSSVKIEQLEAPLPPDPAPGSLLREAADMLAEQSLRAFWEVPFSGNLPAPLRDIAEHRSFGAKLRTGGTEAAAFPSPAQLASALVAAHQAGVALKFTAGLHHPFRRFDAGVNAWMHGFMNVFAASIFLRQPWQASEALVQEILEDENPGSFCFDADGFQWRDWRVATGAISEDRKWVTSFGSCSFDEPRDDLRAAGLLP